MTFLCWAVASWAQSEGAPVRYISDEISVTLRKGEGMKAQVSALVKSGTRVELLESGKDSGYAKVRIAPGREGWVLAKYLSAEPPARERIANMAAKLAEQQALVRKLSAQNERLVESNAETQEEAPAPAESLVAHESAKPVIDTITAIGLVIVGVLIGLLIPLLPGVGRRKKWNANL